MSFIVSNGFNLHETIDRVRLLQWFHLRLLGSLETSSKKPSGVSCFRVSEVSYIIHSVNETEKVFGRHPKGCVPIVVAAQDYTAQHSVCRRQLV